ncbi:DUF4242 domain-containing protein [Paenibacillus filicis]|uniref:DUF4242 domain-containing protein n=1 Tax=Paenibacillus gyeongsangnamensis TaxID=3388067 RepID=A0ABT4Q4F6_9BACL|nr:DUF4242 domain-containing protein [Paenibacillus filicis]MCZ8511708.1 DUF4242 domain-containing protein [Paenibacillus filicis]
MALYLAESILPKELREKATLEQAAAAVSQQAGANEASLIEVQVASDLIRAFFVLEADNQAAVRDILGKSQIPVTLVKPVRLVGQELEEVRKNAGAIRYLVEWNLPEGLTMDAYLARKKEKSVHYAEVPEVSFERTYVCEDMTKCVCLYNAPDAASIQKARDAVGAPIDALTETISVTPDKDQK